MLKENNSRDASIKATLKKYFVILIASFIDLS